MTTTTIHVFNEGDFFQIKSRLIEDGIRFIETVHEDSVFPGIKQTKEYGQIMIDEFFDIAIISEFKDRVKIDVRQIRTSKAGTKTNMGKYLLIGYAIIATLGMLYFWYKNYRDSAEKNYTFEWNLDGTVLTAKDNNTWEDAYIWTDRNRDYNFEQLTGYSKDGKFIIFSNDANENGIFESTVIKTIDFKTIAEYYDNLDIGFNNEMIFMLESKDTLILIDQNGNGFYEIYKNSDAP